VFFPFTDFGAFTAHRNDMGRKAILIGFWLLGYALGFFAWFASPSLISAVESIGLSADLAGALLTGLAGSIMMLVGVFLWSYLSSSN